MEQDTTDKLKAVARDLQSRIDESIEILKRLHSNQALPRDGSIYILDQVEREKHFTLVGAYDLVQRKIYAAVPTLMPKDYEKARAELCKAIPWIRPAYAKSN